MIQKAMREKRTEEREEKYLQQKLKVLRKKLRKHLDWERKQIETNITDEDNGKRKWKRRQMEMSTKINYW